MIIAEIGWNFLGDLDLAKKMIDQVSDAGCKHVKFQLWDPKNLKNYKLYFTLLCLIFCW